MRLLELTGPLLLLLATADVPAALLAREEAVLVAGALLAGAEEDPAWDVVLEADPADEETAAEEPGWEVPAEPTPPALVPADVATLEVLVLLMEEDVPALLEALALEPAIPEVDATPPLLLETRPPTTVVSRWQVPCSHTHPAAQSSDVAHA